MQEPIGLFSWMAWTTPVAIFFATIAALIAAMTIWEIYSPSVTRKGLLPLVTTRGDRLFIGLLVAAYVNLAWTGLTDMTQWIAVAISAIALMIIMRWG
jgi:predicted small integral membrane protein